VRKVFLILHFETAWKGWWGLFHEEAAKTYKDNILILILICITFIICRLAEFLSFRTTVLWILDYSTKSDSLISLSYLWPLQCLRCERTDRVHRVLRRWRRWDEDLVLAVCTPRVHQALLHSLWTEVSCRVDQQSSASARLFPPDVELLNTHTHSHTAANSNAETNLKVGGHQSGAKVGSPVRHEAPEKNLWSCPSTCLALKVHN